MSDFACASKVKKTKHLLTNKNKIIVITKERIFNDVVT